MGRFQKTSQELRLLCGSLIDCKSLFFYVMIHVSKFVSKGSGQLKKNVSFRALPELPKKKPPPMTPIRATWSFFFGSQNSRFESQFRTKTTIYTIQYTVYMQPKKQLKVQYIGIFEEIDSFY